MAAASTAAVLRRLDGIGERPLVGTASALRTTSAATTSLLPVLGPLTPLLPGGGLRRGSVVAVHGSTALLLTLLAAASGAGSWAGVVGLPGLGVLAAAEAGVAVRRLALVPRPGADPAALVAALLDGLDLVVLAGSDRLPAGVRRSLAARARQRGAVLLPVDRWPGADVVLSCSGAVWRGPEGGHGRLRSREVTVRATGRGAAARVREVRLLLPGSDGAVAEVARPPVLKPRALEPRAAVG